MSKTKLVSLGVGCYILFMLVFTPAAWWVKLATLPPQLQLGAVSGSLWRGEVSALQYEKLSFGRLSWQLNGWALLTGKLQLVLTGGSAQNPALPYIKGVVSYGFSGATLNDTMLSMPVQPLIPMLPLPMPVDASGALVLDIAEFSQGQPWCNALQGNASWQDARLQTPTGTWLELQSLFGSLSCDNGTVVLTTDGNNLLGLDIKAVVNAEQLLVNGSLKPAPGMPEEVHQAMQFLGRPDAQGRYPIRF
uniref:Type II secretion system protein N n=1 Tax=Rheinheimera sp. BAL341 TaxID=1708203 RepID=A0A486XPW4_9GAMM